MLSNFFSGRNKAFTLVAPELLENQNRPNDYKVNIFREFPFSERKFPMIMISTVKSTEKKSYIGSDDLLYIETHTNDDGIKSANEVYAGMAYIDLLLSVITTSPDERKKLAELIYLCFSHFYRGQFIYTGENGSLFSIVPASKPIDMGGESEITDESKTTLVYIKDVTLSTTIEYHFMDIGLGERFKEVRNLSIEEESGPIEI
jgi:hypothetical protein